MIEFTILLIKENIMQTLNNTAVLLQSALIAITENASEGTSFKESKSECLEAGKLVSKALSGYEVECFTPAFTFYGILQTSCEKLSKSRSFKAFDALIEETQASITAWLESNETLLSEHEEANIALLEKNIQESKEVELMPLMNRNDEIVLEVKELLNIAAQSFIKVGILLTEARTDAENQKEFLEWTELNFSIKKAQAFKLMKIAKEFENDERFEGCSMRVLDMLTGSTEAVKVEAAALASTGELGSKAALELTKPKVEIILPELDAEESKPFDTGAEVPEERPSTDTAESSTSLPSKVVHTLESDSKAFTALQAQLSKLLEQNDELTRKLEEATKPRRAQSLPMLPHFNSKSFTTRLGLESDASVKEIRGAYRAIVKHYTAEANLEAFTLLTEAKECLAADIAA